jgi:hypothetical protein
LQGVLGQSILSQNWSRAILPTLERVISIYGPYLLFEDPKAGKYGLCPCEVFKSWWWMLHCGGKSPKRHVAYSNSPAVKRLWLGRLKGWKFDDSIHTRTAHNYIDKNGKRCFMGTKDLKSTQTFGSSLQATFDLHDFDFATHPPTQNTTPDPPKCPSIQVLSGLVFYTSLILLAFLLTLPWPPWNSINQACEVPLKVPFKAF